MSSSALQSFLDLVRRVPSLGTGRILFLGLADAKAVGEALAGGLDAHGLTLSEEASPATERITPGRVRSAPLATLPYEDGTFDLVVVLAPALDETGRSEREACLCEARRVSGNRILLSLDQACTRESWEEVGLASGLGRDPLAMSLAPVHTGGESGGVLHLLWDETDPAHPSDSSPGPGVPTQGKPDLSNAREVDPISWLLMDRLPPPVPINFLHPESRGRVSVIIPLYNGEAFIERTIRSVWEQTLPPERIEMIVADDGSNDSSLERVSALSKQSPIQMKVLTHPQRRNLGVSATRNLCFRHAAGEYVALLDADDLYMPHRLQAAVEYLDAHPDCPILCAKGHNVDMEGHRVVGYNGTTDAGNYRDISPDLEPPFTFDQLWKVYPIANSTITLRRRALGATGGYPEQMAHQAEDWLLMLKFSLDSPVEFLDQYLIHYTHHAESYTTLYRANRFDYGSRVEVFFLLTHWMLQHPQTRDRGIQFYRREYPMIMAGAPPPDLRDLPGILRRAAKHGIRLGPIQSTRMLWNTLRQSRSHSDRERDG